MAAKLSPWPSHGPIFIIRNCGEVSLCLPALCDGPGLRNAYPEEYRASILGHDHDFSACRTCWLRPLQHSASLWPALCISGLFPLGLASVRKPCTAPVGDASRSPGHTTKRYPVTSHCLGSSTLVEFAETLGADSSFHWIVLRAHGPFDVGDRGALSIIAGIPFALCVQAIISPENPS